MAILVIVPGRDVTVILRLGEPVDVVLGGFVDGGPLSMSNELISTLPPSDEVA